MEIWLIIIGLPLGFFALLYFEYRDDARRDKYTFKDTIIGILIMIVAMFLYEKFNWIVGSFFGIIGFYLHAAWKQNYNSKKEK